MGVEAKPDSVSKTSQATGQGNPLHYQKDFSYDKAGNRASYQHQNGGGQNYGLACNYNSYGYDVMGRLAQIQDTGRSFTATVTNDWNGNITQVSESWGGGPTVSTFTYDNENRLTEFTIGLSGFSADHTYDGFNRLIKTDATILGSTTNYEHTYAGKKHLGNIDVTNQQQPVNGKVWRWEGGAGTPSADPIEAPQRSSQSNTQYYMLNDERTIEKRSYQVGGVVAGDTNDDSRYAEWQHVNGAIVPTRIQIGVPSELFSAYNITLDADRASSAATNHALQLGATDLEYEVTRVKSPVIGRDMNPMGRGDGTYYPNGGNLPFGASLAVRGAKPVFLGEVGFGYGNDVNNCSEEPPPESPPPESPPPEIPPDSPPPDDIPHECYQPHIYHVDCDPFLMHFHPDSCCNDDHMWHVSYSGDYMCRKCVNKNGLTPGAPIPPWHPCYTICMNWLYACIYCMKWRKRLDDPEKVTCCRVIKRWVEEEWKEEPCPQEGYNIPPLFPMKWCLCKHTIEFIDLRRGPCGDEYKDPPGTKYYLSVSRACFGLSDPGKIYEPEQWWPYRMC